MLRLAQVAEPFTNSQDAKCLLTSGETTQFKNYITDCTNKINPNDSAIANNFLTETINKYKDLFSSYRAQYDDLLISANNLVSLTGNTGNIDNQVNSLRQMKDRLQHQVDTNRNEADSYNKTFLDDIYNGSPTKTLVPTLQDITLLLFWFSWLVMSIVLICVRVFSPGGTLQGGLFVFVILLLVTLCLFAIINFAA